MFCERRKLNAAPGFTLLELLLVLAILATLVAVQLPRMAGLTSRSTVKAQARVMRMVMLTARTQAVQQRRELRLIFEPGGKMYRIEAQVDPLNAPQDFLPPAEGPLARKYQLPEHFSIHVQPERAFLRFRPDGANEDATVRIRGVEGTEAVLRLEASDHRITIALGEADA